MGLVDLGTGGAGEESISQSSVELSPLGGKRLQ